MNITFDGEIIKVADASKNIVDIAKGIGTTIIAPCYRNNKKFGCCNACIILVNDKIKYACSTKPADGMVIVYDREDLANQRKKKLNEYTDLIKSGKENTAVCCGSDEGSSCCDSNENNSCCNNEGTSDCGCSDSSCGC